MEIGSLSRSDLIEAFRILESSVQPVYYVNEMELSACRNSLDRGVIGNTLGSDPGIIGSSPVDPVL